MFWKLIIGIAILSVGVYYFVKTKQQKASDSESIVRYYFMRQYTDIISIILAGLVLIILFFIEVFSE